MRGRLLSHSSYSSQCGRAPSDAQLTFFHHSFISLINPLDDPPNCSIITTRTALVITVMHCKLHSTPLSLPSALPCTLLCLLDHQRDTFWENFPYRLSLGHDTEKCSEHASPMYPHALNWAVYTHTHISFYTLYLQHSLGLNSPKPSLERQQCLLPPPPLDTTLNASIDPCTPPMPTAATTK